MSNCTWHRERRGSTTWTARVMTSPQLSIWRNMSYRGGGTSVERPIQIRIAKERSGLKSL